MERVQSASFKQLWHMSFSQYYKIEPFEMVSFFLLPEIEMLCFGKNKHIYKSLFPLVYLWVCLFYLYKCSSTHNGVMNGFQAVWADRNQKQQEEKGKACCTCKQVV